MKKITFLIIFCIFISLFSGCSQDPASSQIIATTMPVYSFTSALCAETDLQVTQLINDPVSCLHNYTLQVSQMKAIESSQLLVISGAGLEDFLHDVIVAQDAVLDASQGVPLDCMDHDHEHAHIHSNEESEHHHHHDPHIWLSPENAKIMAQNIANGLSDHYPKWKEQFSQNLADLNGRLDELQKYGNSQLENLKSRDLITFHDGFHYFAESFDLQILKAIEEEPGSETSAHDLIHMINMVEDHQIPAIFTEKNGSSASAKVISAETDCGIFALDMAMYGNDYFDSMYHNINTIKEALG